MKKWKKRLIPGAIILVIVAAVGASMFKALDVETAVVKRVDVLATATEKGKIINRGTSDIYSEVQGKVKAVYVDEGGRVEKGAMLAVIDTEDIDAQIAQTEGQLKSIGGLAQAGSDQIKQLRVAQSLAQSAYERIKTLYAEGAATKAELDQAKAELDSAGAALEAARNQYQGQKESLTAQLDRLKSQREKASIIADGTQTVLVKKVKTGDFVEPGALLFTLGGTGEPETETYVNSKDMANIRQGDTVTVTFKTPARDVGTRGRIARIAPVAEEILSSLGILESKIKVTVELAEEPGGVTIIPGTSVDVTIVTQQARNVLAVPKEAVFTDKGQDFIWTVKNGKAALMKIETGVEGDDLIEVKKGLAEGLPVILDPHLQELKEGIKVK